MADEKSAGLYAATETPKEKEEDACSGGEDVELEDESVGERDLSAMEKGVSEPVLEPTNSLIRTLTMRSRVPSVSPPPDGGTKAWLQVLFSHFIVASCWGFIISFGAFQTHYASTLPATSSEISWIGSIQTTLLFLVGVFSGRSMDAGYYHLLITVGAFLQIFGVMMMSLAEQHYYALLLSQGVCFGIGAGLVFTPTMTLISTYFSSRRATAIGIVATGSVTGGLIFPSIVRQLLPSIGFPWTTRIIGFFLLAFNLPGVLFARTRLPPRRSGPVVEWAAFSELPYTFFVAGMFFVFWSIYFAFYYVGNFSRSIIHLGYTDSINLLLVMIAVGVPGRIIPNYVADRYVGPVQTLIPFVALAGIMFFAWIGVHDEGSEYVFACLYGTGSAGIQSLFPATLSSLTTDMKKAGTRMGMGFTIVSMACLTGPPLAGALIQANKDGQYLYAQIWAGCSMLLGVSLLCAARVAKVGRAVRRKV
ncbi:hypothetical protein M8818_004739 [Zalaria obscura]|uniref:Uncharacterized protein n=1 Tax=Zalaria obscura TaxID=2024903 RepID=A0ACC3SBY8_9PEZI